MKNHHEKKKETKEKDQRWACFKKNLRDKRFDIALVLDTGSTTHKQTSPQIKKKGEISKIEEKRGVYYLFRNKKKETQFEHGPAKHSDFLSK